MRVQISCNLSWALYICSKVKCEVGLLPRVFILLAKCYCAPLWDPHFALYCNKLEAAQHFATRVVTQSWSKGTSVDNLTRSLNWSLHEFSYQEEEAEGCSLGYCILNKHSIVPPSFFSPHPSPHLIHNHILYLPLYYLSTHALHCTFEFFICKCHSYLELFTTWNCLPPDIVTSSMLSFKRE